MAISNTPLLVVTGVVGSDDIVEDICFLKILFAVKIAADDSAVLLSPPGGLASAVGGFGGVVVKLPVCPEVLDLVVMSILILLLLLLLTGAINSLLVLLSALLVPS